MDQIERHDVVNAVLLAVVLLGLGFGIVTFAGRLSDTLAEGLVTSSKEPTTTVTDDAVAAEEAALEEAEAVPAAEVQVDVITGSVEPADVEASVTALQEAGYDQAAVRDGPTVAESIVYYEDGYEANAQLIAATLSIGLVEPAAGSAPVPLGDANVLAFLVEETP